MKKATLLVIKSIIGILVLALLLSHIGFQKVYSSLISLKPAFLLALIPLYLLTDYFSALMIKAITYPVKKGIKVYALFKYNILTQAVSTIIPGRLGEFSLIYFYRKEGIPLGKGTAVFVIDKVITLMTVSTLGFIGLLPFVTEIEAYKVGFIVGLIWLCSCLLLITKKGREFIEKRILKYFSKKFRGFSETFSVIFTEYKKYVLYDLLLTIVRWLFTCIIMLVLFRAFGSNISLIPVLLLNSVVFLISFIPLTIQGIGIKETAAVVLFGMIGIESQITISAYLAYLIITTVYVVVLAVLLAGNFLKRKEF